MFHLTVCATDGMQRSKHIFNTTSERSGTVVCCLLFIHLLVYIINLLICFYICFVPHFILSLGVHFCVCPFVRGVSQWVSESVIQWPSQWHNEWGPWSFVNSVWPCTMGLHCYTMITKCIFQSQHDRSNLHSGKTAAEQKQQHQQQHQQ